MAHLFISPEIKPGTIIKTSVLNSEFITECASQSLLNTDCRFISIDCPTPVTVESSIDHLCVRLAETAFALWPDWFNAEIDTSRQNLKEAMSFDEIEIHFDKVVKNQIAFSRAWLKDAINACRNKRIPLFDQYPKKIQIEFLAKTVHPSHLIVLLNYLENGPTNNQLYSIVKTAEWFASHASASVVILAPSPLISHPELASVSELTIDRTAPRQGPASGAGDKQERKAAVWPVVGKPHPFSPGEQLLADYLSKDRELAGLFQFNQRVETVHNSAYLVDLLWPFGCLVIEVDGYQFHRSRDVFFNDRHRDYELTISGYRVLRLDHEEVTSDVALCVEKIRDVVRYIKQTLPVERV